MTTHDTPEAALAAALRPIVSREACFNPNWPEGWAERSAAAILAALDGWTLVPHDVVADMRVVADELCDDEGRLLALGRVRAALAPSEP